MSYLFAVVLGKWGVINAIGIIFFIYAYKNSIKLFAWVEDQTYGTRDYILKKCDLLQVEVKPEHITIVLGCLAFALPVLVMSFFALIGSYFLGGLISIILAFIGWKIPRPFMDYLVESRVKKFQGQMVDGLNLLSNGLRAGLSLPQSIGMVVDELPAPLSEEFNLILQQNKIGVPLEECFDSLNKRIPIEDIEMFVTSVNILRETGGNLAETFDTIGAVIRERVRLTQKIETYVAQGMMQGMTIFAMPFLMGFMFYMSDPDTMGLLFTHPVGIILTFVALGLDCIGGWIILKIVKIKV